MKKYLLIFVFFFTMLSNAQNYNNIVNYSINGTPVNGVKIKTNLPFLPVSQMPTISIKGYNYGNSEPIDLTIVYYVYYSGLDSGDSSTFYFHAPKMSSSGSYTPSVFLSNENGKVVIFINDKSYYQRFTVSAFAQNMAETSDWFQGWTAVDEPITGIKTVEIPYQNRFKGNVYLSGGGIWNADGNVGIGTMSPDEKLTVKGKIHTQEVRVDMAGPLVPDYVFAKDYKLKSLQEVEDYINENKHLPEIPSAQDIEKNGLMLAEMNMSLLKKIEELTLYMIEMKKENQEMKKEISSLKLKQNK